MEPPRGDVRRVRPSTLLIAAGDKGVVWLVWLRTWVGSGEERRIVPELLAVCSSLPAALEMMVTDDTSTWTEPVELDAVLRAAVGGNGE